MAQIDLSYLLSGAGGGDMAKVDYDPANINEQVVGLNSTQTLAN